MSEWLVALDFGTTATAVAVGAGGGRGRALVLGDGSSTVPSSVFAESDGRLVVGVEADNEAELRLDAYEPTPKRRVGDGQIRLGERDFSVAEVIGAVMAPVLGEAMQQHNNTTPARVVLTHPVAWRSRRRAVLGEALAAAGARLGVRFPEPVFVAEPVAAARWYAHTDPPVPGEFFAVYDLGGGTFDTTVLQATAEGFDVIASGGVDPLGGFDFDAALFDYLGAKYIAPADSGLWAGLSLPGQPDPELARQRRRLQQRVGLLKVGLSTAPDKQIQLPGVGGAVVVTRGEYEALINAQIDNTIGELEDTIADAGLAPEKLTAIYRIGGAARTPLVGAALDRFRVPVKVLDQPKLVVAQGAATPQRSETAVTATTAPTAPQAASEPAIQAQTLTTTHSQAAREADESTPREPSPAHRTPEPRTEADGHQRLPKPGARFFEARMALRTIAITLLFFELLFVTGANRPLNLLLASASESTVIVGVIAAVVGATVHTARKYGRAAAFAIVIGGVVGLIGSLVNFGLSRHGGDIAGYVCVLLIFLTRPPRRPSAADAARHGTAGLFVITTTLVMTTEYSSARGFSFAEAFSRFESGDLWLPAVAGLALLAAGGHYLNKHVITQPQTYPRSTVQRGIGLVAIVGVLIPLAFTAAVISAHPGEVYAKRASAPPFDGSYTKTYGASANPDGTADGQDVQAANNVAARSTCGAKGCVAVDRGLSSSDKPQVWDFINGQWLSVTEFDDDTSCKNTRSSLFVSIALQLQTDGSFTGNQIQESTGGCYTKTPVTYRRTGDLSDKSQVPDPAAQPQWQKPPQAIAFHGKYRLTMTIDNSTPTIENHTVETHCLRDGARCLSFSERDDGKAGIPLVYENNLWTGTLVGDDTCAQGTDHRTMSFNFPLPVNVANPIQTLSGSAQSTGSNTCFTEGKLTEIFERTGD